jgi:hypothetical protein
MAGGAQGVWRVRVCEYTILVIARLDRAIHAVMFQAIKIYAFHGQSGNSR